MLNRLSHPGAPRKVIKINGFVTTNYIEVFIRVNHKTFSNRKNIFFKDFIYLFDTETASERDS